MKTTIPSKSFVGYSRSRSVATTTGPCARPNHHQPHFLLSVFLRQAHPERDPLLPGEALASRRERSGRFEASMRQATWRQVACFFESEEEFRAGHTKEARVENPAETSAPDPERVDEMLVLRCPPSRRQASDSPVLGSRLGTGNRQITRPATIAQGNVHRRAPVGSGARHRVGRRQFDPTQPLTTPRQKTAPAVKEPASFHRIDP